MKSGLETGDYDAPLNFTQGENRRFKEKILLRSNAMPKCTRPALIATGNGEIISWVQNLVASRREGYGAKKELCASLVISNCHSHLFDFATREIRILPT